MSAHYQILIFVLGLVVGSFLNVCISRLPDGKSIVRPRSHCPKCGQPIRALDNIPVISYLILGARCRSCRQRISLQYPVVELCSGFLLLACYRRFGTSLDFVGYGYLALVLLVVFWTDANRRIIPDKVTYPSLVLGIVFSALSRNMVNGLVGMAVGFALLALVAWLGKLVFRKDAMGGGDVKLAAVVGAFLGWKMLLVSLFLAFFLGAFVGALIILVRGKARGSEVAFGPFIVVGALSSLFYGNQILSAYLRFVLR